MINIITIKNRQKRKLITHSALEKVEHFIDDRTLLAELICGDFVHIGADL